MDIQKEKIKQEFWNWAKVENPRMVENAELGDVYAIQNLDHMFMGFAAAKSQAVPEWISVADEMPPVEQTVLVCWDYAPDIEPDKEYTTTDEDLNEYWPNCQDEPPTHWMPLPKVIKAQEQSHE